MPERSSVSAAARATSRREFLRRGATLAGLSWVAPAVLGSLAACSNDVVAPGTVATIDMSTEEGALNYFYALTQFEMDFIYRIYQYPYTGATIDEANTFQNGFYAIYSQKNAIMKLIRHGRIPDALRYNFISVNFNDRANTLAAATMFADAVASGFAGAISYLETPDTVTKAQGWASDAAGLATTIRSFLGLPPFPGTPLGPAAVMAVLLPYYDSKITLLHAGAMA